MANKHGKDTYISLDGDDISEFCNSSDFDREHDEHDVTCYGMDDHDYDGGLGKGKSSIGGIYDDSATGPKAVIEPLLGTKVQLIRRPEGTGATKPQEEVTVLVKKYVETNPVADMIAWTCELTHCGSVARTTQV